MPSSNRCTKTTLELAKAYLKYHKYMPNITHLNIFKADLEYYKYMPSINNKTTSELAEEANL